MRVVLLTQDDPFYLGSQLDYLISRFPKEAQLVGCILFDVSPFGKRESLKAKAIKTFHIFGARFFLRYSIKYVLSKLKSQNKVINVLNRHHIPIIELVNNVNSEESIKKIKEFEPDLLISIAGNQIFKKQLIELAPKGCLNLHTALLPKYRGLMPSFWVLKNGEKKTGVSVFFVDEGIDSGPILVQKEIPIDTSVLEELIQKTKKIGMDAIIESINLILQGNLTLMSNDANQSSYFTFPKKEDIKDFLKSGKRFY